MPFSTLKKISRNEFDDTVIEGCIVALGSNFNANKNLERSRCEIEAMAIEYAWSTPFINPDYTATFDNPKPDYTNQCGIITLKQPCLLQTLIKTYKQIEQDCERLIISRVSKEGKRYKNASAMEANPVSIDIDVLMIKVTNEWLIVNQRYPFRDHEMIGIQELINSNVFAMD